MIICRLHKTKTFQATSTPWKPHFFTWIRLNGALNKDAVSVNRFHGFGGQKADLCESKRCFKKI